MKEGQWSKKRRARASRVFFLDDKPSQLFAIRLKNKKVRERLVSPDKIADVSWAWTQGSGGNRSCSQSARRTRRMLAWGGE